MFKSLRVLTASALLVAASSGNALVVAELTDATNSPNFFGRVTFTDLAPNQVQITADISSPINSTITRGDILGLWFDFANPVGSSLAVAPAVFGGAYLPDGVSNSLGGNVNINGSGPAGWDLGLIVGQNGAAGGFNQTVTLSLTATGLSASTFLGQRIGMRVQSILGVPGFNFDSSKLLGRGAPPPPPPPQTVPEPGPLGLMLLSLGLLGTMARRRNS